MILPVHDFALAHRDMPHRDALAVHRRLGATQQRMPREQRFAFTDQAIGAGRRQPIEGREVLARQFDAVLFQLEAPLIVTALAGFDVELVAGYVGKINLVGIFVDQLIQTALPAPVAQRFPLLF